MLSAIVFLLLILAGWLLFNSVHSFITGERKELQLAPIGFILGFIAFILLIWISSILISGDSTLDDPFHILPTVISYFHLNPFRFPVFFLLIIVIPACGIGTYTLSRQAFNLRSNGIKVIGYVTGSESSTSRLSDGKIVSGTFPLITFKDTTGKEYTIRGSTVKWLSGLRDGDPAEVIYLADHPEQGKLNKWFELFFPSAAFGLFTFLFLTLFFLVKKGIIWF